MAEIVFRPDSACERIDEIHEERKGHDEERRDGLLEEEPIVLRYAIFL